MPQTAKKILQWSALGLIASIAAIVLFLLLFDWNHAKPWLNARVSDATGRRFAIQGELALSWLAPDAAAAGWRGWIPWPRLQAQDIHLGNPDWAKKSPNMADIKQLTFSVNPVPLLDKKIVIPTLVLDAPNLSLERSADGKNNWTLNETASAWQLRLDQLKQGVLQLSDAKLHLDLQAEIESLDDSRAQGYGIDWKVKGSYNGAAVNGSGKAGAVLSLQNQKAPYPLQASVTVGKTRIGVQGTLTKPSELAALDLRLKLSGASMAQLYPLTGIVLPETPAFATEGRLIGTVNQQGGNWTYEKFSGKVGASDLSGTLEYLPKQPRPLLKGTLLSKLLQFRDLAPLIGADSNASKAKRDAPVLQPANKVLPTEPFKTERWTSIDADVQFSGRKIVRDKELPIENVVTSIHLQDGVLALTPLNFGIAGGNLVSNIKLDGRSQPVKAEMKISARHLELKQLLPSFEPMQSSFGEINGDASLSATGNSVAALLGSSNGEIKALINEGTVSKFLLEAMGLNIGNMILTKLFGDKQVTLNCVASDFAVTNGVMQAQTFLVDTADSTIDVSGQINLAQEQLGLTIKPENKQLRIFSLRSPLYVAGTFKNPDVSVDKGVLALRSGGVLALGLLAPVTALLPLVDMGPGKDSQCNKLLTEVRKKPVAPPPGKTRRAKAAAK